MNDSTDPTVRMGWTAGECWLKSLGAAAIGGAATAATAWGGLAAAQAAGVDVPVLNFHALGVILLSGGLTNVFAYLKQSPLPGSAPAAPKP